MDLNGQSFDGFNGGSSFGGNGPKSDTGSIGGSFGGGFPQREREREREFEDPDEELENEENQAPEEEEEDGLNGNEVEDVKKDGMNFPSLQGGLNQNEDSGTNMQDMFKGMEGMEGLGSNMSLNGSSLNDIKGGLGGGANKEENDKDKKGGQNQKYDDRPLNLQEQLELEAAATALNAFAPPSGEAVKEIAKAKPSLWRRMVGKIKTKIKLTVFGFIAAALATIILNTLLLALIVCSVIAVYTAITQPFVGEGTGAPALSADSFYGVRVYYTNEELAKSQLNNSYNELAFDFLQSVETLEGVESLSIEFPIESASDYTQYNNELVLNIKCLILQGVINSELEEGEQAVLVTQENYNEYLLNVEHFGLTYENFTEASNLITNYFVGYVDWDIANSTNFITFQNGYTYENANFKNQVNGLWGSDAFANYKITCDLVFVKDVLLDGEQTTHVNGDIFKYIYMAKPDAVLENRMFSAKIEGDSKYKLSFTQVQNGTEIVLAEAVADSTWYKEGEELRKESPTNWLAPSGMVVDEMLDCTDYTINCSVFTNIDESNQNFLAKDDYSVINAVNDNLTSAQKCFTLTENESHAGFYSVNLEPTSNYVCVNVTDMTENGQGTGIKLNEIG